MMMPCSSCHTAWISALQSHTMRQVFLAKPAKGCAGKRCQKHHFYFLEWEKKEVKLGENVSAGVCPFRYDQEDIPPVNTVLYKHVPVNHGEPLYGKWSFRRAVYISKDFLIKYRTNTGSSESRNLDQLLLCQSNKSGVRNRKSTAVNHCSCLFLGRFVAS